MLSSGWVDGWIKIWLDRLTAFCVLILGQILNRLYENCPKIRFFFQSRWILPNTQAKGCTNTKQRFDILVFSIRRCLLLIHGCRGTPKRKNIQTYKNKNKKWKSKIPPKKKVFHRRERKKEKKRKKEKIIQAGLLSW